MFIIEVIPIAKGIDTETLSYFTSEGLALGSIVTVPLRKKSVQGIVAAVRPAVDLKSEIRDAPFVLKKLGKIKSGEFFTKPFMDMARTAADYYASNVGSVLGTLVPNYILRNINKLKKNPSQATAAPNEHAKAGHEKYAVQGDDEERYGTWKSLIRQEFARKKSLLFIFPTVEEAEYAFSLLEKGIEGYAFLLHGSLVQEKSKSKNTPKIVETWNTIMREPHPVAIIATPGFFSMPRPDIETIIVEREGSRAYKALRRPFLDIRHIAEILAEKTGMKLFLADNFLRLETLWRVNAGEIIEASPFKFRSLSTARDTLVDMRQYKSQNNSAFKILSPEVENLIDKTRNESGHMLILATRRGLVPSTFCGDCQNIVTCNNCSSPVILHKAKTQIGTQNGLGEENNGTPSAVLGERSYFVCHRCGEKRSTDEFCKVCGSWKLGVVGIGIDLVEEKIRDKFPDISLFRIDSDTVTSDKAAHAVIHKYRSKPGSILLGTEMMLQYVHDRAENSAIISLDSLFSLPDFRIQEKILSLLIRLRSLTSRDFVVQSRKAEEKVFEYGLKGNMSDFYRLALEERKKFNYPPFSVLIKITLEGKKNEIVEQMEEVQTLLEPYEVEVFPAFTQTVKGNSVLHGLVRMERGLWVDAILIGKLRSLPPWVEVRVDPQTLL